MANPKLKFKRLEEGAEGKGAPGGVLEKVDPGPSTSTGVQAPAAELTQAEIARRRRIVDRDGFRQRRQQREERMTPQQRAIAVKQKKLATMMWAASALADADQFGLEFKLEEKKKKEKKERRERKKEGRDEEDAVA